MFRKKVVIGDHCKKDKNSPCHKFSNMVFQYREKKEWDEVFLTSKKAKSLMPPYHAECDCKIDDIEDNVSKLDINNQERAEGEECRLPNEIVNVVVLVRTDLNQVWHVKLSLEEEEKIAKFIRELHGGTVWCYKSELLGITIHGGQDGQDDFIPPIPEDKIDPTKMN